MRSVQNLLLKPTPHVLFFLQNAFTFLDTRMQNFVLPLNAKLMIDEGSSTSLSCDNFV